jgi:predicted nucleic acid-binding protein
MNAVCNASPLITLAKAGLLELLHALFERVVVTEAVVKEVQAGGVEDPGSLAIT